MTTSQRLAAIQRRDERTAKRAALDRARRNSDLAKLAIVVTIILMVAGGCWLFS